MFKQKTGVDLELRSIVAGANVSVTQTANTIIIAASGGGGGGGVLTVTQTSAPSYNVLGTDDYIRADAGLNPVTVTLPDATALLGKVYRIKKVDNSVNVVTINCFGAQTIDGNATESLSVQYEALTLVSNGNTWDIV